MRVKGSVVVASIRGRYDSLATLASLRSSTRRVVSVVTVSVSCRPDKQLQQCIGNMNTYKNLLSLLALAGVFSSVNSVALYNLPLPGAPQCPEEYGEQSYPHPEDCGSFFLCTNGTLTLEHCENGLLYDGHGAVHKHCNYLWAVDCGNRKADLTPESTPGCEYQFGLYSDSNTCSTSYIKCIYGEPHQESCSPGLAWDEKSHTCIWPDELIPFCNPEAVVGFKCPTKIPKHTASAKFWPFPRFAVPGDCGRLITCVEGHPRLITCGDGNLFDSVTLSCMDPEEHPQCADGL